MAGESWIDISVPLYTGMVHWPDNQPVRIERILDLEKGDSATVSKLSLGAHTGTHVDAPVHFLLHGDGVEALPLAAMIGPARVIAITDEESIKRHELERHAIQRGERLLFKTRNSARCWQADEFYELICLPLRIRGADGAPARAVLRLLR